MASLYPKIPHLPGSRTGPSDRHVGPERTRALTERARDGAHIVVEEKLDGTCVVVTRTGDDVIAFGRDGRRACESRNLGRRLFAWWVTEHRERFLSLLHDGEQACGEWLALTHGTIYELPHEPFVLFDLVRAGVSLSREELRKPGLDAGFTLPCTLHEGAALPTSEALSLLGPRGHHGADMAEGVVYREEHSRDGVCRFVAKLVRQEKVDGAHLADHTGRPHVFNRWPGGEAWLHRALTKVPHDPDATP